MNNRNEFLPSADLVQRFDQAVKRGSAKAVEAAAKPKIASATKIGAEKMTALKQAYKLSALDSAIMSAVEDFEPGVLNDEERSWAEQDPELAKLLAMCSQVELDRMREDRAYKAASSLT